MIQILEPVLARSGRSRNPLLETGSGKFGSEYTTVTLFVRLKLPTALTSTSLDWSSLTYEALSPSIDGTYPSTEAFLYNFNGLFFNLNIF